MVKVTILCSDPSHPVNAYLKRWMAEMASEATVELVRKKKDATGGDLLFLISCREILNNEERARYQSCLVLHASALPGGRGWSPHIWQLVDGADGITLSLLEAEDEVDSGAIWSQCYIPVPKHALWDEINELLFQAEMKLMRFAVERFGSITPVRQASQGVSYYRRRCPSDSEIDPNKTVAEQFDLIRVCDPQRFPAYFRHRGHRYVLKLEKQDGE